MWHCTHWIQNEWICFLECVFPRKSGIILCQAGEAVPWGTPLSVPGSPALAGPELPGLLWWGHRALPPQIPGASATPSTAAAGTIQVQRDGAASHEEGLHPALRAAALSLHAVPRGPRQRRDGGPAPLPGVSAWVGSNGLRPTDPRAATLLRRVFQARQQNLGSPRWGAPSPYPLDSSAGLGALDNRKPHGEHLSTDQASQMAKQGVSLPWLNLFGA